MMLCHDLEDHIKRIGNIVKINPSVRHHYHFYVKAAPYYTAIILHDLFCGLFNEAVNMYTV